MTGDLQLHRFVSMDSADDQDAYIEALEAFDRIEQLQELKTLARGAGPIGPENRILDVGCGFGLETLRIAKNAPAETVFGIDKSRQFIEVARKRAREAGLDIDLRAGDAEALPYSDDMFDTVRAERLLMYLDDFGKAVEEMVRVAKPGGRIALIEAEFTSTTVNHPNRALARRVLDHEIDTAVTTNWLPGPLYNLLRSLRLRDVDFATRVVVFPQGLARTYFGGIGRHAAEAGAITAQEGDEWTSGIETLADNNQLFGSVGYFLFMARA